MLRYAILIFALVAFAACHKAPPPHAMQDAHDSAHAASAGMTPSPNKNGTAETDSTPEEPQQ